MLMHLFSGGLTSSEVKALSLAAAFAIDVRTLHNPADAQPASSVLELGVSVCDGTIRLGDSAEPSAQICARASFQRDKPLLLISPEVEFTPAHVVDWLTQNRIETLHFSGPDEAEAPGIDQAAENLLTALFTLLGRSRS